jgi:hypothetical protein
VGKFLSEDELQAPHAIPWQGNHGGEKFIGNNMFLTHVAQRCRNAFSALSAVCKDQVRIATAKSKNVSANVMFSWTLKFFLFGSLAPGTL